MASRYEVELTLTSAKDLKNVNWRHGPVRPYAVVWVDSNSKCSTKVDEEGDTCPYWNQTLVIPLPGPVDEDTTLYIDIVHAGNEEGTKKLIGSARLKLIEVIDDVGVGERVTRSLKLKRPSGRPQGKLEVDVCVRDPRYAPPRDAYYAPPYGVPPPPAQASSYGSPYTAPPPGGYPYGGYNAPQYGQPGYGQGGGYYGQGTDQEKKSGSKFGGMGTGLAVGAVAGALGGIALVEGVDAIEDDIADDVADKVEDDLAYDDDDF